MQCRARADVASSTSQNKAELRLRRGPTRLSLARSRLVFCPPPDGSGDGSQKRVNVRTAITPGACSGEQGSRRARDRPLSAVPGGWDSTRETMQHGRRIPGDSAQGIVDGSQSQAPLSGSRIRGEEVSCSPKGKPEFSLFANSVVSFFLPRSAAIFVLTPLSRVAPWEPQGCYIALPTVHWIIPGDV